MIRRADLLKNLTVTLSVFWGLGSVFLLFGWRWIAVVPIIMGALGGTEHMARLVDAMFESRFARRMAMCVWFVAPLALLVVVFLY